LKNEINVKAIIDLKSALSDMSVWIKNQAYILSGEKGNTGLLRREILANWLLAVILNHCSNSQNWVPCGDPAGNQDSADGVLYNLKTHEFFVMEHVIALNRHSDEVTSDARFIQAVDHKIKKGPQYALGKELVVLCENIGDIYPNRLAAALRNKHSFSNIWAIGLSYTDGENQHQYCASCLGSLPAPTFYVTIDLIDLEWNVSQSPSGN